MADRHLTFSQRYGYEPLPEPMRLEELSDDLRRELWNLLRRFLQTITEPDYYGPVFTTGGELLVERILGKASRVPEDEIETTYKRAAEIFKELVLDGEFNFVLDLLGIIINDQEVENELGLHVALLFDRHAAAYRLDTSRHPFQFFPRGSKEQGEATQRAIKTIHESSMEGAATHLRQAAEHINAQQFADSVADSILAVESVACIIDPKASSTLGPALGSLEQTGLLKHPALKEAFKKLYGYTSDEQGIRHALLDKDTPDVGLDEATFMFGACASFAAYLVNKHRQMEQSDAQ